MHLKGLLCLLSSSYFCSACLLPFIFLFPFSFFPLPVLIILSHTSVLKTFFLFFFSIFDFVHYRKLADIAPLLDVEDMVRMQKPDWKCVFTYVQSFYRKLNAHERNKAVA